ncbi:MAG: enoyl-CoA hydratase, partial [SAR324 cluster bacterium]|nr:enoyl-CoA hydratase [SAR324 cluster bacterium]
EVLAALQEELDRIAEDQQARLVVIAGNGKAFCAGHDLKQMRAKREEDYYRNLFKQCSKMMLTLNQMPQPVIAKVQGIATAAGCQLVAACDLAVAADDSRFATSGINVGLFCSTPSVPVSRNLGRKQAMELLLTGHFIDAHTALQWGLVNRVVPASRLDQEVADLAGSIMSKSWVAVATGKRMFYKQLELPLESAYDYASGVMAGNMMADDVEEGVDAFMQKRTPVWKHQ